MDRRFGVGGFVALTLGFAACSSGGGSVTSPNPLNPTPAGGGTTAPTTSPSGSASATPGPTPTPAGTATPSPAPSASTGAACGVNDPTSPTTITTPLPPNGGTIALPGFGDLTGSANAPAIASTDQQGQTVTIKISNQNFDGVAYGSGTTPQTGTPVVFTSLAVSANVTFATNPPLIPTTVTGACEFTAGHTYSAGLYTFGSQTQLITGIVPTGNAIGFTLQVPLQTFPTGVTGDVVITQN